MDESSPRPSKRARRSCERCRTRKQKCHGFPVCSNCASAKEECIQPPSAIEEYRNGPNQALLERISFLEAELAKYTNVPKSEVSFDFGTSGELQIPVSASPISEDENRKGSIADIVGFLSLGAERAYVGSSSGFSLASSLGQMVQATIWNKALTSTVSEQQPRVVSLADIKRNSAGPPNDDMGARIIDAYFTRTHNRYPFLDRSDIMERHANRFVQNTNSIADQFGTFKIYMIYAIGSTLLKLTEAYDYTPPENFFMTALQYISAARESHSIHNIQAMTLLVLYNLRSPSNSGIWYMIGLAMRTCVDLGLHREAHYAKVTPYEGQLRRRLFWSVYFLERIIAISLGRPYSIADRDIDAGLPLEIDDTVRDDGLIARTLAVAPSPTFQASRPSSNLTMGIQCIRLMRLESHIQTTIYRVDRPLTSLVSKIAPILRLLENWHSTLPPCPPSDLDYLDMHYNKAIRHLVQPFLTILPPTDPNVVVCLRASGQICQTFKRLHQRASYGHSFIALHSVFIAGVTICYILFLNTSLWNFTVSNDLRACSSALFVMAERTPSVKKYRDALESVISATMDFMAKKGSEPPPPPAQTQPQSHSQRSGSGHYGTSSSTSAAVSGGGSGGSARESQSDRHPEGSMFPPPIPHHRRTSSSSTSATSPSPASPTFYRKTLHPQTVSYASTPPTSTSTAPPTSTLPSSPSPSASASASTAAGYPSYLDPALHAYNPPNTTTSPSSTSYLKGSSSWPDLPFPDPSSDPLNPLNPLLDHHHGDPDDSEQSQEIMDAEWLLSLCEGDGFSLQMLNEMMRFEPSLAGGGGGGQGQGQGQGLGGGGGGGGKE